MTTVGYGDVVPLTFRGKVIGSICAVIGVIFVAMTLPVVVNNFLALYSSCTIVPPRMRRKGKSRNPRLADLRDVERAAGFYQTHRTTRL